MPELKGENEDIEFEVWCSQCGAGICGNADVRRGRGYGGTQRVYIQPCERCIENASDEGYDLGWEVGSERGHEDGYKEGYDEGYKARADEEGPND